MATMLKETDAVVIGVGWTGAILARELTKAGLNVVGLERGAKRTPREDFTIPSVRDDLKYAVRQELFQDAAMETVSLRHSPTATALPIRRLGSFLPGRGTLEWRDLATASFRPPAAQPSHAALRQECHSR